METDPDSGDTVDHPPWYDRFFQHEYLSFDEHPGTQREVDFLVEVLRLSRGAHLLDLCCGYGRHAIPLSKNDLNVTGVDRSPVMLKRASERATEDEGTSGNPDFVRADMSRLPFTSPFDAVISMFSSFGYFEDDDDNFRVLRQVSEVLKPDGLFLLETANREYVVRHFNPVQVYHPKGDLLIEERAFDVVSSRSHVNVTLISEGRETRLRHSIRLYTVSELEMLLEAVGLVAEEVWGDFTGADFTWDSPHMILLARRAD
jgi:ubiquinone/menaquinone biosynthesis C-methylase UbiE